MTEEQIKEFVQKELEGHGFSVKQIPEGDGETPDLLVERDLRYLIEIKSKLEDPAEMAAFEAELEEEGFAGHGMGFHPQNTMSRAISQGCKSTGGGLADRRGSVSDLVLGTGDRRRRAVRTILVHSLWSD
jgi:hypothetical protein